jgi:DNA-binding protein HU-beta
VTRADLVVRMAQAAGWPRASGARALRAMLAAMRGALRRGEPVTLVGFGTFSVARRRPRTLRNPRTGHAVAVAGRAPRFKPSAELKQAVR